MCHVSLTLEFAEECFADISLCLSNYSLVFLKNSQLVNITRVFAHLCLGIFVGINKSSGTLYCLKCLSVCSISYLLISIEVAKSIGGIHSSRIRRQ